MAHFEVIVQGHDGHARKHVSVAIFTTFGKADSGSTDSEGKVILSASDSRVTLFVSGHDKGKIGPGRHLITTDR